MEQRIFCPRRLDGELALACATRIPAGLLGLAGNYGVLRAGARAGAVVFDNGFRPIAVLQGGGWVRALEVGR